jgi:ABC-type uncharacterized transport system permease subunit
MSSFWLWVALFLYSLGLIHSIITVVTRRQVVFRVALLAFSLGFVFHLVSLVEHGFVTHRWPVTTVAEATSLFAFTITAGFLLVYALTGVNSLSVLVFPVVFVITLAAVTSQPARGPIDSPLLRATWVPIHISFALAGYTALFISFLASIMYLVQERELKRHRPRAFYYRLPPLEDIDRIATRTLAVGFPFLTVAIVLGALGASSSWGPNWMRDPKVVLSFLLWFVYVMLVYSRVAAGWRGRKAAYFAMVGLVAALASWAGNYLSVHHSFISPR